MSESGEMKMQKPCYKCYMGGKDCDKYDECKNNNWSNYSKDPYYMVSWWGNKFEWLWRTIDWLRYRGK